MRVLAGLLTLIALGFSVPKLVPPEWLKERLGDPNLVILEFSNSQSYLVEGHIPGARLTEKEDWRVMDERTGALVKKSVEEYEAMFRSWGINNDSEIVIYYKGNNVNEILGAVYAYWIFHLLGHTKVGILDGGWNAWVKKGFPVSYDEPEIRPGNFRARYDPSKEIGWKYLKDSIGKKPIIDGEAPDPLLRRKEVPSGEEVRTRSLFGRPALGVVGHKGRPHGKTLHRDP
ncbi:MAG: rhodanese-like domain-containing protein [Aquificota bacterium]|nr:rhodanese-like domain-containing protein [Aquificota bacterium]